MTNVEVLTLLAYARGEYFQRVSTSNRSILSSWGVNINPILRIHKKISGTSAQGVKHQRRLAYHAIKEVSQNNHGTITKLLAILNSCGLFFDAV